MSLITSEHPNSFDSGPGTEDPLGSEYVVGYAAGLVFTALFIVLAVGIQRSSVDPLGRVAFNGIDAFSTLAFALAGTYIAAQHVDLAVNKTAKAYFTCFFAGMMTAVGGGIIRDFVTHSSLAVVQDVTLFAAAAMGSLVGSYLGMVPSRGIAAAINTMDSVAVAVAVVIGTRKGMILQPGLEAAAATCCAMVCATSTAAGGGFFRDLFLVRQPSALATIAALLPAAGALLLVATCNLLGKPHVQVGSIETWVFIAMLTLANLILSRYKFPVK